MNKRTGFIACALLCLLLAACNRTKPVAVFEPASPRAGSAAVYLYRPAVMQNALYQPQLLIDGEPRLSIASGELVRLQLPPGLTVFELHSEYANRPTQPLRLRLKAGRIYYLRVDTSLKLSSGAGYRPYHRGFSLHQSGDSEAVAQITDCCLKKQHRADNATAPAPGPEQKPGFSVDTTQNPFSH